MQVMGSRAQTRMIVDDTSQVGDCRRAAQRLATTYDFDETPVGRIGIIATELANNLIKHASRGELLLQAIEGGAGTCIELVAIDRGPGMNLELCMRDGYSTTGTPGTGLGAIKRLSTLFDAYSQIGQGTVAVSRVTDARMAKPATTPDFGAVSVALKGEVECGDLWRVAIREGALAMLVVDGLGHGPLAANAAKSAAVAFEKRPFDNPADAMRGLNAALAGGRGAAAAVALLDTNRHKILYSGIGNIAGSLACAGKSRGLVSHNGILGTLVRRYQQFDYDCVARDRIVMHSDGLSSRWSIADYPGLSLRHAAVIAGVLYRDHGRPKDDATIVVSGGTQP